MIKAEYLIGGLFVLIGLFYLIVQAIEIPPAPATTPAAGLDPAIAIAAQAPGPFVIAERIVLPAAGFLVIHTTRGNQPDRVIGHSDHFNAGTHADVVAVLSEDVIPGQSLMAVLYADDGDAQFSATVDIPLGKAYGSPYAPFVIISEGMLR